MSRGYTYALTAGCKLMRPSNTAVLATLLAAFGSSALAAEDPYAALARFDGAWNATFSTGRTLSLVNHCARTGLFYVCEQAVGGKPSALVVILPKRHGERDEVYAIQTLTAAGDAPGPWRELTIDGDRWEYAAAGKPREGARRARTVNTYSGPDYMHFEVQVSTDGETWITTEHGDQHRAP